MTLQEYTTNFKAMNNTEQTKEINNLQAQKKVLDEGLSKDNIADKWKERDIVLLKLRTVLQHYSVE
jgi:hypothetical protein